MMKFLILLTLSFFLTGTSLACDSHTPWHELKIWMTNQMEQERLQTPPWEAACIIPKNIPSRAGKDILNYLLFTMVFEGISKAFNRKLSRRQTELVQKLRSICKSKFPNSCHKPFMHRKNLRKKHSAPPINW